MLIIKNILPFIMGFLITPPIIKNFRYFKYLYNKTSFYSISFTGIHLIFWGFRIFILFDRKKSISTSAGVSIKKACLNNFNNEAWACEACEYIIKIIFLWMSMRSMRVNKRKKRWASEASEHNINRP